MEPITAHIVLTKTGVCLPKRMSDEAAGYDVTLPEKIEILPGQIVKIDLGFKCAIPQGYYARLEVRSSWGVKGLRTVSGIIDSDYRGVWKLCVMNTTDSPLVVDKNERIGQILFCRLYDITFNCVDELNDTKRSTGGFGHTGTC